MFEAIVSNDGATRLKFGACEEIAKLLKWSAVLKGEAQQAGDDIVETDQLGRAVGTFETKKDFSGVLVVMDTDVERSLSGDSDFLGGVVTTSGE